MTSQIIDGGSAPASKTEIDFFAVPPTQVAVERGFTFEVSPQNTLTSSGPYEFHIPPDSYYLDFNKNYVFVQLKITQADGTDIVPPAAGQQGAQVGPINLLGKTFFKQVKLFLNNKLVYDSGDTYAYRAFVETELNFGRHSKETELVVAGYREDAPVNHLDDDQNTGWQARRNWFQGSQEVQFMAPLHVDIFHQEKYMLNRMDVKLELHRNPDNFCLMSWEQNPTYRIQIQKMSWFVRKVELQQSISLALESTLLRGLAKYPLRRIHVKVVELNQGVRDTPVSAIFNGQIPRRVVIACVDSNAFHGAWAASPFNFKNYTAQSVQICAGGVNFPPNPITVDFEHRRVARAFTQMYEALGLAGTGKDNAISPDKFINGCCFYVFDLAPDTGDGGHWELVREGTTTVHINYRDQIPQGGVKMIVVGEFDNLLTVDRFRNVYFDYTP